jgi:hypothetical protein
MHSRSRLDVRGLAFVVALLAAESGAVWLLRTLGAGAGFALPHDHVVRWLLHASTEDLVAVAAHTVGLALAYWLLAATVLSCARRAVPRWRGRLALDLVTPPALRRVLDRAWVLGVGASLAIGAVHPAGASAARRDEPVPRTPAPVTAPPPAPLAVRPPPRAVSVRAGDNLWVIAGRALEQDQRRAAPGAVAAYWHEVIAANAASLRSHDPNLIFPGERIVLPPPPDGNTLPG